MKWLLQDIRGAEISSYSVEGNPPTPPKNGATKSWTNYVVLDITKNRRQVGLTNVTCMSLNALQRKIFIHPEAKEGILGKC